LTPKRALIVGISGQDGTYLAQLLLDKGYEVVGTSRDAQVQPFDNLARLGIGERVRLDSMSPIDFRSVFQVFRRWQPNEIYNLSGQSSVGLSFEQPVETFDSIVNATINMLEAIRFLEYPIRLYNASSSECFGDVKGGIADEDTPFRPRSPYAAAKAAVHWMVANYREGYGVFACNGILFNHESPLRPERFVTRKIVRAAARIAQGAREKLALGNLDVRRDWGWAPEYVEAMWRMLQQEQAADYVVATGQLSTLEDFVRTAFEAVDLDWHEHVTRDPSLMRPTDLLGFAGDASLARERLGWAAHLKMPELVRELVRSEMGGAQAVA
jgi:GDPmannose 4,6-dehydratase